MTKTAGTPFKRISRDEAAALWASNGEVWAMFNCDLRVINPLRPDAHDIIGLTWSVRIFEDASPVFYMRGERGES